MTTNHLHDIRGDEIAFLGGSIWVKEAKWPVTVMVKYDLTDPPRPVAGVKVVLTPSEGTVHATTGDDGLCQFPEVPEGEVRISLFKTEDQRGAITGADALLTLKYLAFLEQLSDPQKLAADVVMDRNVTGADALAILRHLAFFPSEIDCTAHWAIPINLPGPISAETHLDASAYLLGDVTLNWGSGQTSSVSGEHKTSNLPKGAATSKVSLSFLNIS